MKKTVAFCVLAALAALALPAMAEDDESGFAVSLQARFLKPTGMPSAFVLSDPDQDGDPEGTVESVEFSNEISPAVWLGWQDGPGGWYVGFWQFDEDDDASVSSGTSGELWDILYHPDESFDNFTGTADAMLGIDAMTVDLVYGRNAVQDDRFSLSWMAGIRYASLEYELGVLYDDTFSQEVLELESEADGVGFTGGLRGQVKLSDAWSLHGGAFYSYLMGEIDNSTLMFDVADVANPEADIDGSQDRAISILDLWIGLDWKVTDVVSLGVGYDLQRWDNVVATQLFPDDVNEGFITSQSSDVSFDGFSFNVGFRF